MININGGICDVIVIIVGNGHSITSSIPGCVRFHFT